LGSPHALRGSGVSGAISCEIGRNGIFDAQQLLDLALNEVVFFWGGGDYQRHPAVCTPGQCRDGAESLIIWDGGNPPAGAPVEGNHGMLVRNLPLLGEGVVEPPDKWALFVFGGVTLLRSSRQLELKTINVHPEEPRLGPIEYLAHRVRQFQIRSRPQLTSTSSLVAADQS